MAPYVPPFLPHEIPKQVLETAKGKRNKEIPHDFDIKRDCKLLQLWQYDCSEVKDQERARLGKRPQIRCQPLQRLFRHMIRDYIGTNL